MTPVRFGLVGFGFGGRWFHAPLIDSANECDLVSVMTSSSTRRAEVEREFPNACVVESLADLVDLGVQAVAISTPVGTHTTLTNEALRLGLAVVCDKPFALGSDEARETVELAERLGLTLCPYQNRRWDSDFLTVRKLVDEAALGRITLFESRFERYAPADGPGPSGGGTLLDFGSHLVDQALVLLGPVVKVYAETTIRENGLDDDVFVALIHANGSRSHLYGGWRQFASGPRFRVTGTEATYVHHHADTQEASLVERHTPALLGSEWGREPTTSASGELHRAADVVHVESERGTWDRFYPAFAAAVRGVGMEPVRGRDAIETAAVLDAARRSASVGETVELRR